MPTLSWAEAGVVGLAQGLSELFPVSSLGHSVLIPALVGGSWARNLSTVRPTPSALALLVGVHVGTATALILFFRRDWVRVLRGLRTSIRDQGTWTPEQRLGWMLLLATVPAAVAGFLLEQQVRAIAGRPVPAAIFLVGNGLLLAAGEWLRRPASGPAGRRVPQLTPGTPELLGEAGAGLRADWRLARMGYVNAVLIGTAQIAAVAAGVSRSGATMVAGMCRGLSHEDAARYSYLLAAPVLLASGLFGLPDLLGPLSSGVRGQVMFASVLSGLGPTCRCRSSCAGSGRGPSSRSRSTASSPGSPASPSSPSGAAADGVVRSTWRSLVTGRPADRGAGRPPGSARTARRCGGCSCTACPAGNYY